MSYDPTVTGGPAFPGTESPAHFNGMSLRDWLAGQAMNQLLEREHTECLEDARNQGEAVKACLWRDIDSWLQVAEAAYAIADAMLEARGWRS